MISEVEAQAESTIVQTTKTIGETDLNPIQWKELIEKRYFIVLNLKILDWWEITEPLNKAMLDIRISWNESLETKNISGLLKITGIFASSVYLIFTPSYFSLCLDNNNNNCKIRKSVAILNVQVYWGHLY